MKNYQLTDYVNTNGMIVLSCIKNQTRIQRAYSGRSLRTAKKMFRNYLKELKY